MKMSLKPRILIRVLHNSEMTEQPRQPNFCRPKFPAVIGVVAMNPLVSSLPHRAVPSADEMIRHESRDLIRKSDPKSIRGNALVFPDFLESTSTWSQRHIIAFHMLDFNDLPIDCLYPQMYYPPTDDPVIVEVERLFTLSKDDIRQGKVGRVATGPAFSFYRTLQDCLRTQQKTPSPPQVPTRPQRSSQQRVPIHQYTVSDSSSSSFLPSMSSMDATILNPTSEDKSETVSNFLVINYLYLLADLENEANETSAGKCVLFRFIQSSFLSDSISANHDHFTVTVEGKPCGSENDGAAWRSRWSESTRQWVKSGQIPLCSLEVNILILISTYCSVKDWITEDRHFKSLHRRGANYLRSNNSNMHTIKFDLNVMKK